MLTMDDFNKQENTLIKFCAIIKKPHLKEFQLSQKPGLLKLELTSYILQLRVTKALTIQGPII